MEAKDKKPANDIRVGFRTRVGNVISYAEKLLKENNFKTLNFSAVGGSIGTLVNAVEILKYTNKGLYQINRMATISYQSIEEGGEVNKQNIYIFTIGPKTKIIPQIRSHPYFRKTSQYHWRIPRMLIRRRQKQI